MKNLQEMSLKEMKETEGGFLGYVLAFAGWYLYESLDNQAAAKASFNRGYNSI